MYKIFKACLIYIILFRFLVCVQGCSKSNLKKSFINQKSFPAIHQNRCHFVIFDYQYRKTPFKITTYNQVKEVQILEFIRYTANENPCILKTLKIPKDLPLQYYLNTVHLSWENTITIALIYKSLLFMVKLKIDYRFTRKTLLPLATVVDHYTTKYINIHNKLTKKIGKHYKQNTHTSYQSCSFL